PRVAVLPPPSPTRRSSDLIGRFGHRDRMRRPDGSDRSRHDLHSDFIRRGVAAIADLFALDGEESPVLPGPLIDMRGALASAEIPDRKSTRLNSSHVKISYA